MFYFIEALSDNEIGRREKILQFLIFVFAFHWLSRLHIHLSQMLLDDMHIRSAEPIKNTNSRSLFLLISFSDEASLKARPVRFVNVSYLFFNISLWCMYKRLWNTIRNI